MPTSFGGRRIFTSWGVTLFYPTGAEHLHTFFVYCFGGLECVGNSFAKVAHFVFLRNVWIRTQRVAVASRCATNLSTHLLSLYTYSFLTFIFIVVPSLLYSSFLMFSSYLLLPYCNLYSCSLLIVSFILVLSLLLSSYMYLLEST
jgi:hypothetical protein